MIDFYSGLYHFIKIKQNKTTNVYFHKPSSTGSYSKPSLAWRFKQVHLWSFRWVICPVSDTVRTVRPNTAQFVDVLIGRQKCLLALFHCMVRHGTVRYGSLLGGFPLGTVPGT